MKDHLFYDDNLLINEQNPFKRIIKRIIRKSVLFLLRPYIRFQNDINAELKNQNIMLLMELEKQIETLKCEMQNKIMEADFERQCQEKKIEETLTAQFEKNKLAIEDNMGAIARQVMIAKWQAIDVSLKEKDTDILTCKICGFSQTRGEYQTKETDCIFHGGHLIRYICPSCGVIFGPTKFSNQSQKEIDEDYKVHYLGFSEGDSSYKEERAFFMLQPGKEGVYLNYGCGHWSGSLQNLRKQGYKVYGYEPYSPDIENPYMITNKEQLEKMRFDGIYSNDLLEHLLNPVDDLRFMKSLLLDENSKMAHCTSCYIYKYEHTRFHTFFFTGDSIRMICEKSGLKVVDYCDDLEENDFICYVFSAVNGGFGLIDRMFIKGDGRKNAEGKVLLGKDSLLFGPYLTLQKRNYCLQIEVYGEIRRTKLMITSLCGRKILKEFCLIAGINRIEFGLEKMEEDIEFVIQNKDEYLEVENIYLTGLR